MAFIAIMENKTSPHIINNNIMLVTPTVAAPMIIPTLNIINAINIPVISPVDNFLLLLAIIKYIIQLDSIFGVFNSLPKYNPKI
jgi:hypothetical protein